MKERAIKQMLFNLANPVIREMPEIIGCAGDQLLELWQKGWDRAYAECEGDLVKLADAACDELKMLVVVALMEVSDSPAHRDAYQTLFKQA